jgi:hypothetical protein
VASSMKKLIVFGDSWPYGCELDRYTLDAFPAQIEKILEIPVDNQSMFGTSIDRMVHKFLHIIEVDDLTDCGVLFCLTGITRSMILDKNIPKEIHPSNSDIETKSYYSYIFSWELATFNFLRNCLLIQSLCKIKNISLFFVTNWYSFPESKLLDKENIYEKSLIEILGLPPMQIKFDYPWNKVENSEYFYPNKYHPNLKGHRLIAEELSKWISSQ